MPELPEVETIKNALKEIVLGRTITKIEVNKEYKIIQNNVDDFVNVLTNKTYKDVTRIGKFLFFHFNDNLVLISHLRMEGKYYEYDEKDRNSQFWKVVFHFDNGKKLCYDDSRAFGIMILSNEDDYLKEKEVAKLGPEPFKADYHKLYQATRRSRIAIKTTILDQSLMCGLGNIYADETLYACKIHPHTPTNLITENQWKEIVDNSIVILNKAIKAGGSTIKTYHPGKNLDGKFQRELLCYGKEGSVCPRCGRTFCFTKTNGRGTTFCPKCQPKLGSTINVAITGKIASGKSYLTRQAQALGYDVFSCDEAILSLYHDSKIATAIGKMFDLPFTTEVDKKQLRNYLLTHKNTKGKLERFIYPFVYKKVEEFIKNSNSPLRFVEVPLLYKAGWESYFDTTIAVDISPKKQYERLVHRNGEEAAPFLLELNKDNSFDQNKNKAEFIYVNDSAKEDFDKFIEEVINTLKLRLN